MNLFRNWVFCLEVHLFLFSIFRESSYGQKLGNSDLKDFSAQTLKRNQNQSEIEQLNEDLKTEIDYYDLALTEQNFQSYNCHYIINNFNNINLKFGKHPIIIRRPKLKKFDQSEQFIWIPDGFFNQTEIADFSRAPKIHCRKSKYLSDVERNFQSPDLCIRLNLPIFSGRSKPWNCQVDLHLLPSVHILQKINYPRAFKIPRSKSYDNLQLMSPSTRPDFVILILLDKFHNINEVTKWIMYSKMGPPDDDGSPLVTYTDFVLFKLRGNAFYEASVLSTGLYGKIRSVKFNHKLVQETEKGKNGEMNQGWWLPQRLKALEFYHETILHHLRHCGNDFELGHFNRAQIPLRRFDVFNNRLYIGITIVWLEIWGNYSYRSDWGWLCIDKVHKNTKFRYDKPAELFTNLIEPKRSLYYPLSFSDTLQSKAFVSCGGSNGVEGIRFAEIYSIFDFWIWTCIGVSVFVVSLTLSWTMHNDPFSGTTNLKSKPIIAITLLVGIVLSNAYKNANVYKMILPRNILPFTDITQLVAHNFSIYTTPSYINCPEYKCFKGYRENNGATFNESGDMICSRSQHKFTCMQLDSTNIIMEIESDLQVVSKNNKFSSKTKTGTFITDTATLMPLENVFQRMVDFFNSDFRKYHGTVLHVMIFSELARQGEAELFEVLKVCNRRAAVVSEFAAKNLEQQLKRENLKNVFVGKDRYFRATHGFHLKGKMHINVAKRIDAFKFSGIWDWWPEYATKYFEFSGERAGKTIPVPSMEGNIQVIFYLLVGGMILSIFSFMVEYILQVRLKGHKGFRFVMNIFWSMEVYVGNFKCDICSMSHTKVVNIEEAPKPLVF